MADGVRARRDANALDDPVAHLPENGARAALESSVSGLGIGNGSPHEATSERGQRVKGPGTSALVEAKKLTRLPSGSRNSSDRLPHGMVVGVLTKTSTTSCSAR